MQNGTACQSKLTKKKNSMNKLKCDYYLSHLIDFETDTYAHKFMHQTKPYSTFFHSRVDG